MVKKKKPQVVFDQAMIYEMRQAGLPLREIGVKAGISRERVRQILSHSFGSTWHGVLSTTKFSSLVGLTSSRVMQLHKQGLITPTLEYDIGGQHRFMWPATTIQMVKDYYDSHHVCRICNKPLPQNRTHYCSDYCQKEGHKYKNKTPEGKQRIIANMRRYHEKKRLEA